MDKPEPIWPENSDGTYDGHPPDDFAFPTAEQEEFAFELHRAIDEFERVAIISEDIHYRLSHACLHLANIVGRKRPQRASLKERDAMIHWIFQARFSVERHSPDAAYGIIKNGFEGLFVLAVHLAESDAERAARAAETPDLLRDAFDVVRILRNWAHNEVLAEGLEERAFARRSRTVRAIISAALETAA